MGIIAFIILGLLAGIIAKAILPGSDPGGMIIPRSRHPRRAVGGFLERRASKITRRGILRHLDVDHRDRRLIILLAIYRAVAPRR